MRLSILVLALAVCICALSADAFPKRASKTTPVFMELELPPPVPFGDLIDRKDYESFKIDEAKFTVYEDVGPTFAQIERDPAKFAKEFPLRAVTVEAVLAIRKLDRSFPVTFADPVDDAAKKKITDVVQRAIADNQGILDEFEDRFTEAKKKRDDERSLRWQAHFDFVHAQVKVRLASVFEYNVALGYVKTENLPALDPAQNHDGWQLIADEKIRAPKEIRKLVNEANDLFDKIIETHPGTPWAELSQRSRSLNRGLKWQPVHLEKAK